jgi:hypothetical protein
MHYRSSRSVISPRSRSGGTASPFTSLMAITFGWLIVVPPFVSTYRTLTRIQAAQEISGTAGAPINVWLGFLLYLVGVFTFPVEILYAQSELNRLWRTTPEREAAVLPPNRHRLHAVGTPPPPIISHRTHPKGTDAHPRTTQRSHEAQERPIPSRMMLSLVVLLQPERSS